MCNKFVFICDNILCAIYIFIYLNLCLYAYVHHACMHATFSPSPAYKCAKIVKAMKERIRSQLLSKSLRWVILPFFIQVMYVFFAFVWWPPVPGPAKRSFPRTCPEKLGWSGLSRDHLLPRFTLLRYPVGQRVTSFSLFRLFPSRLGGEGAVPLVFALRLLRW